MPLYEIKKLLLVSYVQEATVKLTMKIFRLDRSTSDDFLDVFNLFNSDVTLLQRVHSVMLDWLNTFPFERNKPRRHKRKGTLNKTLRPRYTRNSRYFSYCDEAVASSSEVRNLLRSFCVILIPVWNKVNSNEY